MQHPETVTVVGEDGKPLLINKTDVEANPDKYAEWKEKSDTAKGKGKPLTRDAAPVVEPPPILAGNPLNPAGQPEGILTTPTVVQKGDTFFVVDDKGEDDARFNAKGYKTDVEAWTEVAKFEVKTVTA